MVDSNHVLHLRRLGVYDYAFGKAKWGKYIGDVGVEPPLPENIREVLESSCPYWRGKKIKETHMLTLIPATVDGEVLTLERLGELVKTPKVGYPGHYRLWFPHGHEKAKTDASYWVLMTKDVIPGTRNESYVEQQNRLKEGYEVPKLIEAAASILMAYISEKKRCIQRNPLTYTRCQEEGEERMADGGSGSAGGGLVVLNDDWGSDYNGLASVRRFCPQ